MQICLKREENIKRKTKLICQSSNILQISSNAA